MKTTKLILNNYIIDNIYVYKNIMNLLLVLFIIGILLFYLFFLLTWKKIDNMYVYKIIMNLSLVLFVIGILGFVLNRKNIILMLICIEIMLLAIAFLILVSSLSFDDILGQIYSIYIIAIAGAESAIGLGIFVAFYRLRGSIAINDFK